MEKITRQWVILVLCSVYLACGPSTGLRNRSSISPPPAAPAPAPPEETFRTDSLEPVVAQGEETEADFAELPAGEELALAEQPKVVGEPEAAGPAAEELVPDPPSSTISHLAGEAPDVVVETEAAAEDELALIDELNDIALPDDFDLEAFRQERLRNTESELPVVLNSQVAKFINYFTGRRGKVTMVRTLERAGAFRTMIERILEEEGVPAEMFHLAQAESGFRPKARSRARATGMWQFMKFRGRQYGLRQDKYVDERYDPEKATRAAARHLLDLYIEFGDWYLAMAAYNGGPNRVKRAVERTKSKDYWEHSRRRFLRRETRNYVPIILAMTYVGKNLDMYGIEIKDPAPPLEYDTVETDSEIHLDLIADIAGTTAETIKQLNPALLRSATPPYSYDLRLPKGSGELFLTGLEPIPGDKRLAWRRHYLREGEALATLAKRYRVKESQIVAHNQVQEDGLSSGAWLTIPAPPKKLRYYGSSGGGAGGFLEPGTGRYRIARGDNLGSISRRFSVSIANLRKWNRLSGSRIIAGRYLIVKTEGVGARASSSASMTPPLNSRTYRIQRGDTLGTIARRHAITVAHLKAWNGLRGNRIRAGDRLIVGESGGATTAANGFSGTTTRRSGIAAAGGSGQYRIRRGDNLATIARRFGVTVADLKQWNGLRSSRIGEGNYLIVRPPSETVASAAAASTSRAAATSGPGQQYRIRRGDNLAGIATRLGVSVNDLKRWNGISGSRIAAGDTLTIYPARKVALAARPAPARSTTRRKAAVPSGGFYTIRRGDNLGAIAERFGVGVTDLKRWNGLRGTRITAGKKLIVSQAARSGGTRQPTIASGGDGRYRIRRGDTLAVIASRFGVSVQDLMAWNGLRNTRIREGRYLTVSPANGGVGDS